ncbi:hypothetical protein N836_34040 [Leptolyngbya sp. Heron Island J]|uniref:hypothetical protein n=1 Tax=Leptolyngbya sp. Heron Island J TaxID=1385935 RepID=UPI0003B96410|nr:hypothetical protein [Leptolyngbya sp. Heron Island J]ESA38100.1 hypothetical protein N836_34040 [Leptolyngbya sp. Heron Island J]
MSQSNLTQRQTAQNPALVRILTYYPPSAFSIWGNDNVEVAFFPDQQEAMVISGDFEVSLVEGVDSAESAVVQHESD